MSDWSKGSEQKLLPQGTLFTTVSVLLVLKACKIKFPSIIYRCDKLISKEHSWISTSMIRISLPYRHLSPDHRTAVKLSSAIVRSERLQNYNKATLTMMSLYYCRPSPFIMTLVFFVTIFRYPLLESMMGSKLVSPTHLLSSSWHFSINSSYLEAVRLSKFMKTLPYLPFINQGCRDVLTHSYAWGPHVATNPLLVPSTAQSWVWSSVPCIFQCMTSRMSKTNHRVLLIKIWTFSTFRTCCHTIRMHARHRQRTLH